PHSPSPPTPTLSLHDALPIFPAVVGMQTQRARPDQSSFGLKRLNFRSGRLTRSRQALPTSNALPPPNAITRSQPASRKALAASTDRKSTRLNSSHRTISYAVF